MQDDYVVDALETELASSIHVSDHGLKRMRQRLGLPKSAVSKEVERALDRGVARTEFSGRMRRLLDALYHRNGHYGDYRIYRGCIFIFKADHFVTVFPLPNGLQNTKAAGRG